MLFEQIILNGLQQIIPTNTSTQAGSPVAIQLNLHNRGIATPGQAMITLPDNTLLLDKGLAQLSSPSRLLWSFDLDEDETKSFNFWLQRPRQVDSFTNQWGQINEINGVRLD